LDRAREFSLLFVGNLKKHHLDPLAGGPAYFWREGFRVGRELESSRIKHFVAWMYKRL
jgi:hypothetical protein